jgi:hypothetical protein
MLILWVYQAGPSLGTRFKRTGAAVLKATIAKKHPENA